MDNKHTPHMYGVSERIVKKIVLECLDDKLLFDKLEDEISDFINSGGVDSKINDLINEKIDELRKQILDGVIEDYDTLKEIADWINEHQDLYESLVSIVEETVKKTDFNTTVQLLQEKIDTLKQLLSETQEELDKFKLNNFAVGEYIDERIQLKNINQDENWYPITKVQNIIGLSDLIYNSTKIIDDKIELETNRAKDVENKLQLDLTTLREDWEESLTNAAKALDMKVSWSDGNKNKIVLPNHGQIVGVPNEDELEDKFESNGNASLLMLSKWNVVDVGSIKYPVNLNGPENLKPTYNNKPLAFTSDIDILDEELKEYVDTLVSQTKSEILGEDLSETFGTLKKIEEWAVEHGTDYTSLLNDLIETKLNLETFKDKVKKRIKGIETTLEEDYVKNSKFNILQLEVNDIKVSLGDYVKKDDFELNISKKVDKKTYDEDVNRLTNIIKNLRERLSVLENKEYSNVKGVVVSNTNTEPNKKFDAIFGGMGIKIM